MRQLEQLEAQLDTAPDAVHLALDSIPLATLRGEARALYAILRTQADYKCYVPLTTDSLIRYATTYYNRSRKSYRAAMGDPELTVYTNETTHPSKYIKMEFYPDSTFVEGLQDDSLTVTSLGDNGTAFYKDDFRYAMGNTTVPVIACIKRLGYYILAVKSGYYIWENGCNVLYLQDQKFFGGNITYKSDVIKIGNNVDTNQEVGDVQIKNDATLLFDSNKRTIIQNGFKCAKGAKLVLK